MLIVNADDFGLTLNCTHAIAQAYSTGLISDTTMVANGEAFEEAIKMGNSILRRHIGIHFNITEGIPITEEIAIQPEFCENGSFHGHINRFKPLSHEAKRALRGELEAQLKRIEKEKIYITHADSHHHIHTAPWIAPIVMDVCREHKIKAIRLHRNMGQISWHKRFLKDQYNAIIRKHFITTDYFGSASDYMSSPKSGNIEIMVHPDYDENGRLYDRVDGAPLAKINPTGSYMQIVNP